MFFNYSGFSVSLLFFFLLGILFASLLLKKGIKDQDRASLWLSLFIYLCALYIAPFMLGYGGWYSRATTRDIMFYVPFQQLFLIGPILYFYTQSLLNQSFKLHKKDILHFLPAIGYLLYSLIVFFTDKVILQEYYFYADGRDKDLAPWYQVAGLISMLFYLILSLRFYFNYKKLAVQIASFADSILFRWILNFLIVFLIILLLRVLFFILNPEWGEFGSKYWYYLCFSILFCYIAINGYSNTIRASIAFQSSLFENKMIYIPQVSQKGTEININPIEHKTETTLPNLEEWKRVIEKLMEEEQLFKNPVLTLLEVSEKLETTPRQISQIVNQGFQLNFNDFVNRYRVLEMKSLLQAGAQKERTLLALALDCGFNSKTTFNRAFKKDVGVTPRKYLESLEK